MIKKKYPDDFINKVILGDNLEVMKNILDESINLIYLDPPYGSNNTDKIFGLEWEGIQHYISWMRPRLQECRRVLKSTGSIYLHCDPTASHYLKIVMDAIFGVKNFRNEIVWCYSGGGIPKKDFPRKHDTIFRYTKDIEKYKEEGVFNTEYRPYGEWTKEHKPRHSLTAAGGWLDMKKGTPVNDWWADLKSLTSYQKEWLGYPTQKPESLLERIIKVSSNEGDIVLDPFCGSGNTLAVAWSLNRNYIGIDNNKEAVRICRGRPQLRQLKL